MKNFWNLYWLQTRRIFLPFTLLSTLFDEIQTFKIDLNNSENYRNLEWYQENCRFYVDEDGVEEWDFVAHFDTEFISKRFLVRE